MPFREEKGGGCVKLYPHQEKGLELTKGKNKVAFYWDMGL